MRLLVAVGVALELIAQASAFGAALVALRLALPLPAKRRSASYQPTAAITMAAPSRRSVSRSRRHLCRFQQAHPVLKHSQPAILVLNHCQRIHQVAVVRNSAISCALRSGPVNANPS